MIVDPPPQAHLQFVRENFVDGWVETAPEFFDSETQIEIDGQLTIPIDSDENGLGPEPELRVPFHLALPEWVFDGQEHSLAVSRDGICVGEKLVFQSRYTGMLDSLEGGVVHGWAVDLSRPGTSICVDILVNGKKAGETRACAFRGDLRDAGYCGGNHGFAFLLPEEWRNCGSKRIEIRIPGSASLIIGDPLLVVDAPSYDNLVYGMKAGIRRVLNRSAMNGETSLHNLLSGMNADEAKALLQILLGGGTLPDLLFLERRFDLAEREPGTRTFFSPPMLRMDGSARCPPHRAACQPVDVVVPIYKGVWETVQCLQSVVDSANSTPFELVCILDNPYDREMAEAVQAVARGRNIRILVNEKNVGFVKSVNRGMRLHPDRDVVLLNSDTVVHHDWLDRLRRAAHSAAEIGTVTPLSNSATICSYPHFCRDNDLPPDCTDEELDRICEAVNPSTVIDIPTAVGFCMYIRRDCIDSVGLFDEKSFGKGYGEENDFCRRAARRGWRNVLGADTFVRHLGNVSFGVEKAEILTGNLKLLEELHPYYHELIAAFITADPIRPARRRIDAIRLRQLLGPVFCFVTHDFGGGTTTYIDRLGQALIDTGISPLVIRCLKNGRTELRLVQPSGARLHPVSSFPNLIYDHGEFEELVSDLTPLSIEHFHFQTNINVPDELLTIPARLGVPYDCTAHDYSWICPRVTLVDETRKFCGEPPVSVCERCIKIFQAHPDWTFDHNAVAPVRTLRERSAEFFRNARRVFCPSNDVKTRLERYFPDTAFVVKPHEERLVEFESFAVRRAPGKTVNVLVIGAIGIEKGSEVLRSCAYDAWKRALPLRFVVIGYTNDDENFRKFPNVTVSGRYNEQELPELLREHEATLAFFPAVWPETFSYTLSITIRHGLYPVAFDLGAIAERIRATGFGHLLPLVAADSPELVNRALLEHAGWMTANARPTLADTTYVDVLRDYYDLSEVPSSRTDAPVRGAAC